MRASYGDRSGELLVPDLPRALKLKAAAYGQHKSKAPADAFDSRHLRDTAFLVSLITDIDAVVAALGGGRRTAGWSSPRIWTTRAIPRGLPRASTPRTPSCSGTLYGTNPDPPLSASADMRSALPAVRVLPFVLRGHTMVLALDRIAVKHLAHMIGSVTAVEVDHPVSGWSVTITSEVREPTGADGKRFVEDPDPSRWLDGVPAAHVPIEPTLVSGQRLLTGPGSGETAKQGVVVDEFEGEDIATATTAEVDGVVVTRVAGEIDMSSVDVVGTEVTKQLDLRPAALVLDLTALTFLASSGLTMLIEKQQHALAIGAELIVVADQNVVLKPLEIAGIRDLFAVCRSLPEAIRSLQGHPASE